MITIKLKEIPKIKVTIKELKLGTAEADPYTGSYTVVPKAYDQQVLLTKNKLMTDDVTVEKVPYYVTSNTEGGQTAYIAKEVGE